MYNNAILKNRVTNDINYILLVFVLILILGMTLFSGVSEVGFDNSLAYTGKTNIVMMVIISIISMAYAGIVISNMNKMEYKYFYGSIPVSRKNIFVSEWMAVVVFIFSATMAYDVCRCIELKKYKGEILLQQLRSINEFIFVTFVITVMWFFSTLIKRLWLIYVAMILSSGFCVGIFVLLLFLSGYFYIIRLGREFVYSFSYRVIECTYFEFGSKVNIIDLIINVCIYMILILLIIIFIRIGIKNYNKYNFSSIRIIPCVNLKKAAIGIIVSIVTAIPITLICYLWFLVCKKSLGLVGASESELAKLPKDVSGIWEIVFYGNHIIATKHLWKFEIILFLAIALGIKIIIDATKGMGQTFLEMPWED